MNKLFYRKNLLPPTIQIVLPKEGSSGSFFGRRTQGTTQRSAASTSQLSLRSHSQVLLKLPVLAWYPCKFCCSRFQGDCSRIQATFEAEIAAAYNLNSSVFCL
ncbi:hypothetical protein D0Y65_003401 [Glycine soja]|uniref:Uncharacterized protein n=1 Tax=Glycine soja TaxID=3848 RepID=A0A445LLP5_GLYSO|nr:hypothetical protein D0Y65_003401 [Glycine soja]